MAINKKNFILRISEDAYDALARWAEDEFRSMNGQMEMLLDKALRESGRLHKNRTVKSLKEEKPARAKQ